MKRKGVRYRVTGAIFGALSALALWWLGGFDFNERGAQAVGVYVSVIIGAALNAFLWGGFSGELDCV